MHIETILAKAFYEYKGYFLESDEDRDEDSYTAEQLIEQFKVNSAIFDNRYKERFIYLFAVFLHINSKEDIKVQLNNEIFDYGYEVLGYKNLDRKLIRQNDIFLNWLHKEILKYDFNEDSEKLSRLTHKIRFHHILQETFDEVEGIKDFIYDTSKPQKSIYNFRLKTNYEVYEFKKHTIEDIDLFFRGKADLYEESTLKIAYWVALIKYLPMYNQYTTDCHERPKFDNSFHKPLEKIYQYLIKSLEKVELIEKKTLGRKPKNKDETYKLKWNGRKTDLRDLINELIDKGWLEPIEENNYKSASESIMNLFDTHLSKKGEDQFLSFYQTMKPDINSSNKIILKNNFTKIVKFKK
jgi:GTPase SAR1 family protein